MSETIIMKTEFDQIVKIECLSVDCKHNLAVTRDVYCNLKYVQVGEKGQCLFYVPRSSGAESPKENR